MKLKDVLKHVDYQTYICLYERVEGLDTLAHHKPLAGVDHPVHLNCDGIRHFLPWLNRKVWVMGSHDDGTDYLRIVVEKK